MVGAHEDVFHKVLAAHGAAFGAHASACLGAVFVEEGAFHVSHVGDGDDHFIVGDGVLYTEVRSLVLDGCAAVVAVFVADFLQFAFDDAHQDIAVTEYLLATGDEAQFLFVFVLQFLAFHAGELAQTHLDDGLGLQFAELPGVHKSLLGLLDRFGFLDKLDNLVDDVDGTQETLQQVGTTLGLGHVELGAAGDHLFAVLDKVLDEVFEVEQHGTAMHQCNVVDGKGTLQLAELEELVEYHVGHNVVAQHIHHAGAFLVRLVAYVGDTDNLTVFYKLGLTFDHLAFVHAIGNGVCDDDVAAFVVHIDRGVGTEHHAAAACGVGVAHAIVAVYRASAGEVGSLDILHQLVNCDVVIVYVGYTAVEHLAQVVGGHIGCHTHGDAV